MNASEHLLTLPEEILRQVLFQVQIDQPRSIGTFRLVSKSCRSAADEFFYRRVSLHDQRHSLEDDEDVPFQRGQMKLLIFYSNSSASRFNQQVIARILDPNDNLFRVVRKLQIGPFQDGLGSGISEESLVRILQRLRHLEVFCWSSWIKIPSAVLQKFHALWPQAELHVTSFDRRMQPLDIPLLSSPQLAVLRITVLSKECGGTPLTYSEFKPVSDILVNSKKLKVLSLRQARGQGSYLEEGEYYGTLQLVIPGPSMLTRFMGQTETKLPYLEELHLHYLLYYLGRDHCAHLGNCLTWSSLRRLHLGRGAPKHLLSALCGKVPNLKAISFGFYPDPLGDWKCDDPVLLTSFFSSIERLEEISVRNYETSQFPTIWPSILEKHGPSLRKLLVTYENPLNVLGWSPYQILELSTKAPRLEHLNIELGLTRDNSGRKIWPVDSTDALARFTHLRSLRLSICVTSTGTAFGNTHGMWEDAILDANSALLRELAENDPQGHLQKTALAFWVPLAHVLWTCYGTRVVPDEPSDAAFKVNLDKAI